MNAYSFDSDGIYTGECKCQRDPMRSQRDGVDRYLLPANATLDAPPAFDPSTQRAVWNGSSWSVQEIPVPDPDELLAQEKETRVQQSKADLAAYLEAHPLLWTDGEYYSITAERQAQLTSTLVCAQADGQPPEWNSTGGVCREWDVQGLTALGSTIKNRVKALVKYQQEKEIEIRNASTQEALDAIEVDYDSVG